jgi:pyruvate ferredoxin oxidoreductase delta subunit
MALKTYKEIPIGGMIEEAGSSKDFKTGEWKTFVPVWDKEKCTQCMICPVLCPEDCIPVKKGENPERLETDFDYCKGCGICANVCPVKCIEMKEPGKEGKNG